jgi:hypothetical protein
MSDLSIVLFRWLPAAMGLLAVASALLCLWQFFAFRRELEAARQGLREVDGLAAKVVQLANEVARLSESAKESEPQAKTPAAWPLEAGGMNLNRRGQVLRLYRRGSTVEEIASMLRVAQGEVELMVKVHDLSQAAAASSGASL